jgi:diketogulonate reductase-like aldo/keto reductase
VPIFGTKRRARLRENLGALEVQLAAHDRLMLEQTFAPASVSGARYGAAGMAMLDRGRDAGMTDAT